MSRTLNLQIFKNDHFVGSRSFSQEVIKIGKLGSSDLNLADDTVARMHAVLEVTAGDLRLVDLGSASGTALNGQRVHKSCGLRSGDSLQVGPFRIQVEVAAAPVASITPAPAVAPAYAPAAAPATSAAPAYAPAPAPAPAMAPAAPRAVLPIDVSDIEQPEHHVAQVIASYGNTVLDVQHVGQVKKKKGSSALMAAGAAAMLAGLALFGSTPRASCAFVSKVHVVPQPSDSFAPHQLEQE